MKFIDKLERKYGRFGIPNLTIYIIVCCDRLCTDDV